MISRATVRSGAPSISSKHIGSLLSGQAESLSWEGVSAFDQCLYIPDTEMLYSKQELRGICLELVPVRFTEFDPWNQFAAFMRAQFEARGVTLEVAAKEMRLAATRLKHLLYVAAYGCRMPEMLAIASWYSSDDNERMRLAKLMDNSEASIFEENGSLH
ncbi:MAG: hypothetical protein F6K42_14705 [Leptolyngbya sp. SIO1D8]|nr:hypothetical protein [Leptolyngbya sp. SIO1D8]